MLFMNSMNILRGRVIGIPMLAVIWISLLALTSLTVAVAGIDLGKFTLLAAMAIAAIKSSLVINIFMRIKTDALIFRVFIGLALMTLFAIFVLTAMDLFFRVG
jgi:cytochrome c oxidase subunit 4